MAIMIIYAPLKYQIKYKHKRYLEISIYNNLCVCDCLSVTLWLRSFYLSCEFCLSVAPCLCLRHVFLLILCLCQFFYYSSVFVTFYTYHLFCHIFYDAPVPVTSYLLMLFGNLSVLQRYFTNLSVLPISRFKLSLLFETFPEKYKKKLVTHFSHPRNLKVKKRNYPQKVGLTWTVI